jgi:general secretion pathway protein C
MNALFKKYFWIVNLTAIAGLAWVSATAANELVAGALFSPPRVTLPELAGVASERPPAYGRIPAGEGTAEALVERRVFDLDPPEPETTEPEEAPPEPAPEETPSDGLDESELPVNLMGTMVSTVETGTSIATLEVQGENKLAWVGSEFLDGGLKVVAINPRHILVEEAGKQKVIRLWSEKKAKAGPPPGREPPPGVSGERPGAPERPEPSRPTPGGPPGAVDYAKAVTKTGAYDYEIRREMIDEQLQDMSKLGSEARVVPNYRGGKYDGFKLVGVRPGSLYRAIGIRSGDVIKAVNGNPIDSPNKALDLFEKLKTSNSINLQIERRGQSKEMNYSIK